MDLYKYNLSKDNVLTTDLFADCHLLIDNIENFVAEFISQKNINNKVISKYASIHPSAIIGDNVFIDDNVVIGPYCYVKSNSILLFGVNLGYAVEVDRCLLFDEVKISHHSCIGRCIIGKHSNLAFNFVIATKNLVNNQIRSVYYDNEILSSRKHHGAVIGEELITGVNVSIMPGSTIEHNVIIKNNICVSGHINANSLIYR